MRFRYIGLLAAVFLFSVWAGFQFGSQADNYAYDRFFRAYRPDLRKPESIILAIDEASLASIDRGMAGIRRPLAQALRLINVAQPKAVVVDIILTDRRDAAADRELAEAFRATPHLVLSSLLMDDPQRWENPRPDFAQSAAAQGHVYALPDGGDAVTRAIPLDAHDAGHERRWAIALEAFRISHGSGIPLESPDDLEVGGTLIPFRRLGDSRLMRVRYFPPEMAEVAIPRIGLKRLLDNPRLASEFAHKVVFVGVTATSEVRDRLFTPYGGHRPPPESKFTPRPSRRLPSTCSSPMCRKAGLSCLPRCS